MGGIEGNTLAPPTPPAEPEAAPGPELDASAADIDKPAAAMDTDIDVVIEDDPNETDPPPSATPSALPPTPSTSSNPITTPTTTAPPGMPPGSDIAAIELAGLSFSTAEGGEDGAEGGGGGDIRPGAVYEVSLALGAEPTMTIIWDGAKGGGGGGGGDG